MKNAEYAISLLKRSLEFYSKGKPDEAMALLKESESIFRELGSAAGIARSLAPQAIILQRQGQSDEALRLVKEAEQLFRIIGDERSLQNTLSQQAEILIGLRKFDEATKLCREAESICRHMGDPSALAELLMQNVAFISEKMGRPGEALPLAEEAYRLAEDNGFDDKLKGYMEVLVYLRKKIKK